MAVTIDDIKALNFGYLTGEDLLQFCSPQLLIKQYTVDNNSLQNGFNFAQSEVIASFTTRYDLTAELVKTGTSRALLLVKIMALLTIRNALGSFQELSEKMKDDFNWADYTLKSIRNGQMNLPLVIANINKVSTAYLTDSTYLTLG
jgi:hypothetical protein